MLTRRNPGFDPAQLEPHFAFLAELRAQGRLGLSGGFSDRSGGAYVLQAADLEEARRLAFQDPLHTSNSSQISVHEWNVAPAR